MEEATDEDIPLLPGFEKLLMETSDDQRTGWVFEPVSLQLQYGGKAQYQRLDSGWFGKVISKIGKEAKIEVVPEDIRPIAKTPDWNKQRQMWRKLKNAPSVNPAVG